MRPRTCGANAKSRSVCAVLRTPTGVESGASGRPSESRAGATDTVGDSKEKQHHYEKTHPRIVREPPLGHEISWSKSADSAANSRPAGPGAYLYHDDRTVTWAVNVRSWVYMGLVTSPSPSATPSTPPHSRGSRRTRTAGAAAPALASTTCRTASRSHRTRPALAGLNADRRRPGERLTLPRQSPSRGRFSVTHVHAPAWVTNSRFA